jgi:hypothetical protein
MTTTTLLHLMTGEIQPGDVVLEHGMRVRIDEIHPYHPGGRGCVSSIEPRLTACGLAWACHGTVLNVPEVIEGGIVPRSFMYDHERDCKGPGHGREDFWNVQGNNLARWAVERTTEDGLVPCKLCAEPMPADELNKYGECTECVDDANSREGF